MQKHDQYLPVELIHELFGYLSTTEILQGFLNINSYFNSVIRHYKKYHVDFRSCLKINFDRICSYIQPDQIVSLILSNNNDTSGQFRLFISKFTISQFQCLRSITLINIENDLLLEFIDKLNNPYLQSLTIIPGYNNSPKELSQNTLKKLFSHQLKRLDVYNTNCEIAELQQILSSIPMLVSLRVTNHTGGQWMVMDKVQIQLKRLALNLDIRVSINNIKEFLRKLLNLKHLELQIKGNLYELCNGERWSSIVKQLITFDFDFKSTDVINISPQLLITSFCSSFWLEKKRWFVAYESHPSHVFTVPRFANRYAYYNKRVSFRVPEYSTVSSDQSLFHDHISNLIISIELSKLILSHRFMHVKILSIPSLKLLNRLQIIVDLTQVQCLKLTDTIVTGDLERLTPNIFPQIYELHLPNLPKCCCRQLNRIEQIRTLNIQTVNSSSQLCRQFPCVERLYIRHVESYRQINYILNHLKPHLSYVSLSWSFVNQPSRSLRLVQHLLQQNQEEFSFIHQCHSPYSSTVHLWINCDNTKQSRRTATTSLWNTWLLKDLIGLFRHSTLSRA